MKKKKDLELYISQAHAYLQLLKETNTKGKHNAKIKATRLKIKQASYALEVLN